MHVEDRVNPVKDPYSFSSILIAPKRACSPARASLRIARRLFCFHHTSPHVGRGLRWQSPAVCDPYRFRVAINGSLPSFRPSPIIVLLSWAFIADSSTLAQCSVEVRCDEVERVTSHQSDQ